MLFLTSIPNATIIYATITTVLKLNLLVLLTRSLRIIGAVEPVCLAQVLLDFISVVGSQFWDGKRTGPDFVSPMSSLTKRQSGHLSKLVFQYSKSLPACGPLDTATDSAYRRVHPQEVVVLDLDEVVSDDVPSGAGVAHHRLASQYTTPADVDLMAIVPILLSLLVILRTGQWSPAIEFIAIDFIGALILGPGTLTLIRRIAVHPTELDPGDGFAVLMDDDLTVVIQGSQRVVEAITEGGFYLSFVEPQTQPHLDDEAEDGIPVTEMWQERQLVSDILCGTLEGGCRGVCLAIMTRLFYLHASVPFLKETAFAVIFGRIMIGACWWGFQASANDSLSSVEEVTPLRSVTRLTGEFLGLLVAAACLTSASSTTILLHGVSFFAQTAYFGLFAKLVLQSQNYRIRMERLLDALCRPSMRKCPFRTRASAATFVCLVLCRDIPRPVKNIDVLGVLDTLIPNQRDVWRAWKERVADRIAHEERINFAPTIPTFPDSRQKRLKLLLDEAQSGYKEYISLPPRRQGRKLQ